MRSEVIVPLVAYLALVFLLSLYAFRQRAQGNFFAGIFPRQPVNGRFCAGDDHHRHLYQRQLVHRRPGRGV